MNVLIKGCKGVLCYPDDMLLWGRTKREQNENIREVPKCVSDSGMKLNSKCVFAVEGEREK